MREEKIAQRYAKALMLVATDDALLLRIENELAAFAKLCGEKKSLFDELLENPSFSKEDRVNVIKQIAQQFAVHELVQKFLVLLVEKGRAKYLPSVHEAFLREMDAHLGRVRARITSFTTLEQDAVAAIADALQKRVGKKVVPEVRVDTSVLGGMKANIGGLLFDGTLQTRLAKLKQALAESPV